MDAVAMLLQAPASCGTAAPIGPASLGRASNGSTVRNDSNSGQYLVKWDVPSSAGTCWIVSIVTADGSSLHALFQVK
jgi:hypothetical protein